MRRALVLVVLGALALPTGAIRVAGAERTPTLRRLGNQHHLRVGTAIGIPEFDTDPEHLAIAAREYSSVTPENHMKWGLVHPEPDRYDFSGADRIVDWSLAHGKKVRGHTLVWHSQNPEWLVNGNFTRSELIEILRDHIHTVVRHFRGRVHQWDVVNEVVADDGTGLRDTFWLRALGPDYLPLAFRFAHEADPHAKLYVNDYGTDVVNPKSDFVVALAFLLRHFDVPVHGIGLQMHRFLVLPESGDAIEANVRRIAALGFQIWITELDVSLLLPADDAQLAEQAQVYGEVFDACLAVRRCRGITTWGFTDRYSWIPSFFPGFGAALPFDEDLARKPAYGAIVAALQT